MATRDIVPRADGEGQIGTTEKAWLSGHFKTLYTQKIENDSSGDTPDYVLSAYASWADAISTISTTVARLIVDTDATVSADSTVPSTLMVKVYPGCVITVATTKTLTINGVFDAGLYQVFSCAGSGKVVFGSGSVSKVHPEWWATNTTPGTTDMAAAVQAALTTQMRTIITGINLIKSQITCTSLTGIEMVAGAAGELRFDTLDQGFVFTSCTGVKIVGLKIAGVTGRLLMFVSSTDIYVLDNDISGVTHIPSSGPISAVYMDNVSRIWIERNYFHGNGDATSNSEEITTWNNQSSYIFIRGNYIISTGTQYGIFLNCQAYGVVTDNFINMQLIYLDPDSSGYGIAIYSLGSETMQRLIVSNNVIVRCSGCGVYIIGDPCLELTVSGNTLYNVALNQSDASLEVAGISIDQVTGATITGNRVNISGKDGIGVTNSDQVTVSGNTVEDCAQHGIRVRGTGHEITITGNIVQDCESYGIIQDTAGTHENIVVSNNIVRDITNGGVYFTNTTYSIVSGNTIDTTGLDGVNIVAGTQNLITGNRIIGVAANYIISHNATAGVVTNNNIIGNTGATTCNLTGVISKFGNQYSTGVSQGQARLSSGTVTVSTAEVVATDNIQISYCFVDGSTMGILSIGTITAGTSFVINSSSGTDSNFVFWQIVH